MSSKSELYSTLLAIKNDNDSGKVYVYGRSANGTMGCLTLVISEGEVIDINDSLSIAGDGLSDFDNITITLVELVNTFYPAGGARNPNAPNMDRLLSIVKGDGTPLLDGQKGGALGELSLKIDRLIMKKGLDRAMVRGEIGLKAGVLMDFHSETPDDPAKAAKVKAAAIIVLGEDL